MPLTASKHVPGVRIGLDNPQSFCSPGDTVNGYFVWRCLTLGSTGFIRPRLFGRVKTKITRQSAITSSSTTRGRALLFDLPEDLYTEGESTNGEHACPFTMSIPVSPPKLAAAGGARKFTIGVSDKWRASSLFLSSEDDGSRVGLPFSYRYDAASAGVRAEAFVEYVLHAELHRARKLPPMLPLLVRPLYH